MLLYLQNYLPLPDLAYGGSLLIYLMETLLDHDQASMELLRQLFPDTPGLGNEDLSQT